MRDILDDDAECNSCAVMCYSGVLLFLWLLLHTRAAYAFMQFNSALSELNVGMCVKCTYEYILILIIILHCLIVLIQFQ